MRGAIQMSLGFIIAVVFAVVLLSLSVMWLRGMMGSVSGLTTDLTQQSRNELQRTFGGAGENFAIFPSSYDLSAGSGVKLLGGIKNNAGDGKDHTFVINIVPTAADKSVLNVYNCDDFTNCEDLKSYMQDWVTWDKSPTPIGIAKTGEFWIEIRAPSDAPQRKYMFKVYACYDTDADGNVPMYSDCVARQVQERQIWSTPKSLVITVKG